MLLQFVQFCLVGAFSTAVNVGILNVLMGYGLGVVVAHVIAFSLAVTNGFFMNRAWTFRTSRHGKLEHQYVKFFLVNVVGLGLSLLIVLIVGRWLMETGAAISVARLYHSATGRQPVVKQLAYSLGELVATAPCSVWNFTANKLWTFGSQ